jgi:hypothetical protein
VDNFNSKRRNSFYLKIEEGNNAAPNKTLDVLIELKTKVKKERFDTFKFIENNVLNQI